MYQCIGARIHRLIAGLNQGSERLTNAYRDQYTQNRINRLSEMHGKALAHVYLRFLRCCLLTNSLLHVLRAHVPERCLAFCFVNSSFSYF